MSLHTVYNEFSPCTWGSGRIIVAFEMTASVAHETGHVATEQTNTRVAVNIPTNMTSDDRERDDKENCFF